MLDRSGEAAFAAVLSAHQLRAFISANARYCGRWRDQDPACDHGTFHLIDSGACIIRSPALETPLRLGAGDLVVFAHGSEHVLHAPEDGGDAFTTMLCGEFEFATGPRNPIVDALPDCFVVRERDSGSQFRELARLMTQEANRQAFAAQVVLDRLADALFIMAVRHYLAAAADERRGLLAALCDARLGRVLEAMHRDPGRAWTVAALATIAHQSRTAFAQHFGSVLGVGPVQYLTQWRMTEALRLLRDPGRSVAAVADGLGYRTEAAFRRAFKRVHGFGPGSQRRRSQAARSDLRAPLARGA
jgi:AraC-like DNA-binding protein